MAADPVAAIMGAVLFVGGASTSARASVHAGMCARARARANRMYSDPVASNAHRGGQRLSTHAPRRDARACRPCRCAGPSLRKRVPPPCTNFSLQLLSFSCRRRAPDKVCVCQCVCTCARARANSNRIESNQIKSHRISYTRTRMHAHKHTHIHARTNTHTHARTHSWRWPGVWWQRDSQ